MDPNLTPDSRAAGGQRLARLGAMAVPAEQDLLAIVAHELRGPLEAIGMAVGVATRSPLPEVQRRAMRRIELQAEQMSWLVKDLLDIGRANSGRLALRMQALDLQEVVDAAAELARPLLEARQHRFTLAVAARAVQLVADRVRLTQVLSNLLISVAQSTEPRARIRLVCERLLHSIVITIAVAGHRLKPESVPKPANSSTTAAERGEGPEDPGIGLALTRRLVALHGGRLEIAGAGGTRGARYSLTLPQ